MEHSVALKEKPRREEGLVVSLEEQNEATIVHISGLKQVALQCGMVEVPDVLAVSIAGVSSRIKACELVTF